MFIKLHILPEAGGGREITRILEHSICGERGVLGGGQLRNVNQFFSPNISMEIRV